LGVRIFREEQFGQKLGGREEEVKTPWTEIRVRKTQEGQSRPKQFVDCKGGFTAAPVKGLGVQPVVQGGKKCLCPSRGVQRGKQKKRSHSAHGSREGKKETTIYERIGKKRRGSRQKTFKR